MSNTMKSITKAKAIFSDSQKIASIKSRHEKVSSRTSIDKHGIGFKSDNRFFIFSVNVKFSAHTGSHGSSSWSTFDSLSTDEAGIALIEYLSENEDAVLKGVAEIMARKAKTLVDSARAEIAAASADIDSIEGYECSQ